MKSSLLSSVQTSHQRFFWSACDLKKKNMALPSKSKVNEKSQEEPNPLGGAVIIVIVIGLSIFKNICGS
jgi:hypothetical protein